MDVKIINKFNNENKNNIFSHNIHKHIFYHSSIVYNDVPKSNFIYSI